MRRFNPDRLLVLACYVLLVLVVAFGALWINNQFDDAKRERCLSAALQTELVAIQTDALDLPPEPQGVFDATINELVNAIHVHCGFDPFVLPAD